MREEEDKFTSLILEPADSTGYDYPKPTNPFVTPTRPPPNKPNVPSARPPPENVSTNAPTYLPPEETK